MNEHAYAVILAGGYGERFWPMSTARRPKQLLSLLGPRSMLGMAVDRLEGLIPPERVIVLTSADLVDATVAAAPDLPAENVIGEPMRRDTAAAVALAAAVVQSRDPDAVFCILTADHVMADVALFRETLRAGLDLAADRDVLVTIGIHPTHASTAFGYVESGPVIDVPGPAPFHEVTRFVEKPDAETAASYLEAGTFWWNSGMFMWSVVSLRAAFARHQPPLAALIDALAPSVGSARFSEALRAAFDPLPKISIDYALMERADNIVMIEGHFGWDDVGSWPEVANHLPADHDGNVTTGDVVVLDARSNVVLSEGRLTAVVGVDDLIVVHAEGATLICPKDRAQDVKKIVAQIGTNPDWAALL